MSQLFQTKRFEVLGIFLCAITLCALLRFGTIDDLYITFTYARHLAEGYGFSVWNVNEPPVEGATSTVWLLLLAMGMRCGLSPFWLSFILSSLSFAALVSAFAISANRWERTPVEAYERAPRHMLRTATLLTLTYIPLAWYGATGMETTFFAFLLTALLLSPLWLSGTSQLALQSGLSALIILTRPEGMLLGPLLCGYFYLTRQDRRAMHLLPLATCIAVSAGLTLFRIYYFGNVFPNTYYAKAAGSLDHHIYWGSRNLVRFLAYNLPAWLIIAAGMFHAWRKGEISNVEGFLCSIVAFYFLYMLKSGGDPESAFPLWRHFIHTAPIWLLLGACAIERLTESGTKRALVITCFILLTQATLSVKYIKNKLISTPNFSQIDDGTDFFNYIASVSDSRTLATAGYAGHWGWYFPGNVIDMWGLNDRHIAHFGQYQKFGELDSRSDMAYVFSRHPDLVNLDINPADVLRPSCPAVVTASGRSKALRDAIFAPEFKHYYFLVNAPYHSYGRALFVRDTFIPTLIKRAAITPQLISTSQTSLLLLCKP